MLGQENPSDSSLSDRLFDKLCPDKATTIYIHEDAIDPDDNIYMFTWSPDPKELPDIDFETQHEYNVDILATYLKYCKIGIMCVESTQKGNPHYHGWYQINPVTELQRIAVVKTLMRFGDLKIQKVMNSYRINSYTKQGNALHYYKKDVFSSMLLIRNNPITKDSSSNVDVTDLNVFFLSGTQRTTSQKLLERRDKYLSAEKFYSQKN